MPISLLESPYFSKKHLCWPETQLCLPRTQQAQQISAHAGSKFSYSQTSKSAFDLQRTRISFVLDCLPFYYLVVVHGNQVDHNYAGNSTLVFDPPAFHLHKRNSHGSSRLGYSGLEGCCLA